MPQRKPEPVIRQLAAPAEHRAAVALFAELWRSPTGQPPVSADVLRALAFVGGYVAGAFMQEAADGELVGASVGFLGAAGGAGPPYLHSHITGVVPGLQGRGVGYALKLDQREWALRRGMASINWTFDPLIRRNAYFNIARLGALPTRYLTDFYGEMTDGVNAGQGSDRLLVEWPLDGEHAAPGHEPDVRPLVEAGRVLLDVGADGGPRPAGAGAGGPLLIRVPADIEALRRTDPGLARSWRAALREALGATMAAGHRVTGATRSGWYLLEAP